MVIFTYEYQYFSNLEQHNSLKKLYFFPLINYHNHTYESRRNSC